MIINLPHTIQNEIRWIFCMFPWQWEELYRKDFPEN
jgi:hypothetical protein